MIFSCCTFETMIFSCCTFETMIFSCCTFETMILSCCTFETVFQERVRVDLLEGGSVGNTTVISCADGERKMSGYSLPIDFVLKSTSS